ncbi:MAG: ATP-binding protein [Proteocatella sp.]|nr:ATP-binding protein [Proteocatella sp.]
MKLLEISFDNIGIFEKGFNFDLIASDRVLDEDQVYNIYNSIYSQNVVAVTGSNASGKTSLLKLLRIAFKIVVDNAGLDDVDLPEGIIRDGTIMSVVFFNRDSFFKLVSTIGTEEKLGQRKYCFKEEIIYEKKKSEIKSKGSIKNFDKIVLKRSQVEKQKDSFLKSQDSIVSKYSENKLFYDDTIRATNLNIYYNRGNDIMPFVNLFDNSIEYIKSNKDECEIKFKNNDQIIVAKTPETDEYLSSGTIKGSNIFYTIAFIMRTGGYLVIDEIENHIQKKLVQIIIGLFTDKDINKNGATLIFSTHYSEILDNIERKDNIYVLRRDQDFVSNVIKYSDFVDRNDIKKSEVLLSNYIEGTSPNYERINTVKELLCKLVNI